MANPQNTGYAEHEDHFRSHFRDSYEGKGRTYGDFEPAYRSGFRYGTSGDYDSRSFGDLEPEMRRSYEKKHGEGTWGRVKDAARHAFQRGRSHRSGTAASSRSTSKTGTRTTGTHTSDDVRPKSPSGSSETASGGPDSVMREGGFDVHREAFRSHHKSTYGDSGRDFGHHEPAYRLGHRYGTSGEHRGRSFGDLEPEMRRSYEKKHGQGTWGRVKDAARHAFRHSRSRSSHSGSSRKGAA